MTPYTAFRPHAHRTARWLGPHDPCALVIAVATPFIDADWGIADDMANGMEDIWWILEGKGYPRLWWKGPES
jgi:hypothetical protein